MEAATTIDLYKVAEITLSYSSKVKPSERPVINGSKNAYDLLLSTWDSSILELQEQFKVLLLNRANKVLGLIVISLGGISGTVADSKLIFCAALKCAASGIIVAHNHPSGNLKPSQSDIDLTKKLKEGGRVLEIQLLDHVIVTTEGYFSFADESML